ncbi:MFS transporter [Serratia marcescens]|uniref:MFS transporter n=1 Tax=Serratia marcescens TaxID=615 RepID=UPI00074543A0|nr:MFS transporter [Serratia marcescens]MBH2593365.1 MFS transporter [Serratia marcescens]CUY07483.1 Purine ribonucleoside efflux pump nepI [Serratia marcescens]CUZ11927.1 Purine ribonucleoside efflux pump nepI [Serratia marcescens]CUZ78728.1 Purine ribonucleoside efflux pump nepI [Serratia marcescens]CVA05739.1 Purine ribonucleoside efflux pump nepI [Serratia marcescens]
MSALHAGGGAKPWLATFAIGLSTFTVVTAEMLPVGLLTPIVSTLNASIGRAGLLISLPALFAALFAPLVVLGARRTDRRSLLIVFLLLLIAANLLAAAATSMALLFAARILLGFCIGGIWAIAGGLAERLVPPASVGLALSVIFGGVAAASVLGVPLGVFLGEALGWRMAFLAVAVLAALTLLLLLCVLPPLPVTQAVSWRSFTAQRANRRLRLGLLLTFLLVAGHFMAYTFVRPLLQTVAGIESRWVGALLFAYGVAGIVGNFIAGQAAAKRLRRTLALIAFGLALAVLLLPLLGRAPLSGGAFLLLWGIAYGGVSVSLMAWMLKAAPDAVEVASSLYIALFNLAISCGSLAGGLVVDAGGLTINGVLSGIVLLLALAILMRTRPQALTTAAKADSPPG